MNAEMEERSEKITDVRTTLQQAQEQVRSFISKNGERFGERDLAAGGSVFIGWRGGPGEMRDERGYNGKRPAVRHCQ